MAELWAKGDNLKSVCPLCSGVLVVRQNRDNGDLFVGCRSFPTCKMNRPLRDEDERDKDPKAPVEQCGERSENLTGLLCSVCKQPQFMTPSGATCSNGHGGADGVNPETGEVVAGGYDGPDDFESQFDVGAPSNDQKQPGVAETSGKDASHTLHVELNLNPEDDELNDQISDMDTVGIPVDLDELRARRDAGHDVVLEVVGRMLPNLVETMRRLIG